MVFECRFFFVFMLKYYSFTLSIHQKSLSSYSESDVDHRSFCTLKRGMSVYYLRFHNCIPSILLVSGGSFSMR